MRRGILLIVILGVLGVGLGAWVDTAQRNFAMEYLAGTEVIRQKLTEERLEQAFFEQTYLYAKWQVDERWLNFIVSHHHTRAVTTAMLMLTTALEQGWEKETLQALDALEDALRDIRDSDYPTLENFL